MSAEPHFIAPETTELSELLPAYDIQAFIAKGGMGAVYLAKQKSLDRSVAIKILPREFGEDKEFRKQFEAEAKAMAKLNHPNLIGVYDFGEVDGMPYIVMEYVAGKSLYYSAYNKVIDQSEACRLVLGICEGLAHAHEAGILHRDIKPANILLDSKANPKIGDFGLARAVESREREGIVFGTPGYTAPEVLKDPHSVGKRSDIFSTGVILYELLTGELPGKTYVPASQKMKVNPRFDRIIRRATHPSPTLRYADGAAMAAELKPLLEALNKPSSTDGVTPTPAAPKPVNTIKEAERDQKKAAEPPQVIIPQGNPWALLRNLVIIVLLLAAIFGMIKANKWKKDDNARKEREHQQEQNLKKQEDLAKAEAARIVARNNPSPPIITPGTIPGPPDPPVPPKPEEPLEALARLKSDLADGERGEFPPGTEERGSNRLFFVETPMNWQDAAAFAEDHGGFLATCPTDPDSNWLSSKIPNNLTIWLGGGAIGRTDWGWVDGNPWTQRQPSISTGTSAALTSLGTIKARPPGQEMPFFIQWHMDGTNPGSLATQLTRTRESLATPTPTYPPGSFTFESRRYLLVARRNTWTGANSLAQLAEGQLAVPSDPAETSFLQALINESLPAGQAAWIGGLHNGRAWAWTTGEPWAAASWAPGSPDGDEKTDSGLRLVSGENGGWDDADPNDENSTVGLLIEWSKDSTTKSDPASGANSSGELARLRKIGSDALGAKTDDYRKELFANGKSFKWDLDFWHRSLPSGTKATLKPGVDKMKELVREDGSVPGNIPRSGMPLEAAKFLDSYLAKQKGIHSKFLAEIERLRLAYLNRLAESRATLEDRGLKGQVQALENEINGCGRNASDFYDHFNGSSLPAPDRDF